MSHSDIAFHQLLNPLPRHEFEGLAREHHKGQKLRSASRWDQFVGMAMPQLSGRQSLRDIESNLAAQQHKLYHLGAKPVARSSLARINEKQPAEFYENIFYKALHRCKRQPSQHSFRFKKPLYFLDASIIDLSVNPFPWAHCHQNKAELKLNVGLNHGNMLAEFIELSDGN